jgi:hypothetical protein
MRLSRFLRLRPIVVLVGGVCAFAAWLWYESVYPNNKPVVTNNGFVPHKRLLPPPVADTPVLAPTVLPKLRPGMPRTEVEDLLGAPAPTDIHPATVAGGRVTYFTAYETDLAPVPTVRSTRPIASMGRQPPSDKNAARPPRTLVTLEFDATKPGHPLVGVHYPDPLF